MLFIRTEKELFGLALERYPIAPQLDACRLLVGQYKLPDFTVTANPSHDVLSQCRILEHGLRHGGHVDSLIGICDEKVQLFPGNSLTSTYSWSQQRLYLSMFSFQVTLNVFFFEINNVYSFTGLHVPGVIGYSTSSNTSSGAYSHSFQCS